MASVKHVPAVTLQLWESLLKKRGYEITDGELIWSPSKLEGPSKFRDQGMAQKSPTKIPQRKGASGGSVISLFRRANSFAPTSNDPSAPRQPFQRISTAASFPASPNEGGGHGGLSNSFSVPENEGESSSAVANPSASKSSAIFVGLKFRALGEARNRNVRAAIEGRGGIVILEGETDEDVDYIVVRLVRCASLLLLQRR
jgi:DNA replication regulator DPB11